jgi:immune inhibitor A
MAEKQDQLRQQALEMVLRGKAKGKVIQVAKGQYVKLANEGKDRIFVVITEFGDARHAAFPDVAANCPPGTVVGTSCFPGDGSPLTFEGPLHNKIPQPDRSVDNSTLWQADYNQAHYQNMYFDRMVKYYESQSSGRYSVEGAVTEWVKVPFNEARYGRDFCGDIICNSTWFLIRDAMAYWVQGQLAQGKSVQEIHDYLATFDKQDRYDIDADGNFDEPDGFIDHFQIVHAGGDQAAGDPQQGTDAIWSHRWYAAVSPGGPGGLPGVNAGQGGASGGLPGGIPNNPVGIWVGDYTIQPENGGLGVFAHEFAHDLGLPDLYDTSGNTGGAENSTAFWTLMSSGANIGDGDGPPTGPNGIGDAPTDMGAWEKFQLGWLGFPGAPGGTFYDVGFAGQKSEHKLGPAESANKQAQALFVVLPDKRKDTDVGDPKTGSFMFWSGAGNNVNNTMSKALAAPTAAPTPITVQANYDTEEHFDFWFVEASSNGTTFTPVVTDHSSPSSEDQSGINASGAGIDGTTNGQYELVTATLPAGTTHVRIRYTTDPGLVRPGVLLDDITVGGTPIGTAETENEGWTFAGFQRTSGVVTTFHFNAYVAENRQYIGYDQSLRTAYNFGFLNTKPDWLEYQPYQNGLLISYWDESFADNNVGTHPGGGLILPIDAHPGPLHWSNGWLARPRIQSFDSTFGLEPTDPISLHRNTTTTLELGSQPAVPVFDDTQTWWSAGDGHPHDTPHVTADHDHYHVGWIGVNPPKSGTQIRVKNISSTGFMEVQVGPAK